jgi:hypothetical protein
VRASIFADAFAFVDTYIVAAMVVKSPFWGADSWLGMLLFDFQLTSNAQILIPAP